MISLQNEPKTAEMHDISELKQQDNEEHESARFEDETAELGLKIKSNGAADDYDNDCL